MSRTQQLPASGADDAGQLAALGYSSEFKREMSLWGNFSLGFTYLSPVVGVYTLFAYALGTAGPAMIWAFLLVGLGQFLVANVFSEVVAQYPIAGGVYPWARRLWGKKWAWMTGWVYAWAMLVTIAGVAYGAAPYAASVIGMTPSTTFNIAFCLVIIAAMTLVNLTGTKTLAYVAIFAFTAELIGALAVGGWLLLSERNHPWSVVFDSFGTAGAGSYLPAFLAGSLIALFMYYGFEACGDVAEEIADPGKRIPKSMRMTIYIGGGAATFVAVALVMAVPDIGAVISGADADPVSTVLTDAFGHTGLRLILGIVMISFLSCVLSLQAAASRLIYSYARDKMVVGHKYLSRFHEGRHVPPYALLVAAVVPALIVLVSLVTEDAITKIVSFASLGIYMAFQMVVLAALRARFKGWRPSGKFSLGRLGFVVNVLALAYGVSAMINLAWPRTPDAAWYDNYIVALGALVVVGLGVLYMVVRRPYDRGDAPAGDAIQAPSFADQRLIDLTEIPAGAMASTTAEPVRV
jgi:amino acid transporter